MTPAVADGKTLVVVTGATASGKTSLAIDLALELGCDVVSADSRQIYKGLPIGTAAPTAEERARVCHHFVDMLPLDAYYSAARYEEDALAEIRRQWEKGDYAVVCGGSMMYVDALTDGIDLLPEVSPEVRSRVADMSRIHGPEGLLAFLEIVDPDYFEVVDRANMRRVEHAVEISLQAARPYSSLLGTQRVARDFRIVKLAIDMPREQLFDRINRRVDLMMEAGLEAEARGVYGLRHLNSLNTVGYKEMFAYFDGEMSLDQAVARIAKNTRVYAKKQLTWLKRPGVRPALWLPVSDPLPAAMKAVMGDGL